MIAPKSIPKSLLAAQLPGGLEAGVPRAVEVVGDAAELDIELDRTGDVADGQVAVERPVAGNLPRTPVDRNAIVGRRSTSSNSALRTSASRSELPVSIEAMPIVASMAVSVDGGADRSAWRRRRRRSRAPWRHQGVEWRSRPWRGRLSAQVPGFSGSWVRVMSVMQSIMGDDGGTRGGHVEAGTAGPCCALSRPADW